MVAGELVILDMTLVGFFLGKKPSFSLVKSALLRQWKIHGRVEIMQLLHGGFAFRFTDLGDRDSILDGNVYYVGGQPMFIRQWDRCLHTGGILGLRKVPLWVTLPGLPLHLWGEEALSSICSVLGNPLYSDRTTAMKNRLMFARVCVEFSGDTPLLDSINIEDDMGMKYVQHVTYEWKPPHCLSCGVFGHSDCASHRKIPAINENDPNLPSMEVKDKNGMQRLHEDRLDENWYDETQQGTSKRSSIPEKDLDLDEGWKVVRARKTRSSGFGASNRTRTRPHSNGDKGFKEPEVAGLTVTGAVSTSYWSVLVPDKADQVLQSESIPKHDSFSNSSCCSQSVSCPPYPLEHGDLDLDKSGMENRPTEDPILNSPIGFEVPPSGSSAGHTPFQKRLSSLARDLRTRKVGLGISNMSKGLGRAGGLHLGPDPVSDGPFLDADCSTQGVSHETGPTIIPNLKTSGPIATSMGHFERRINQAANQTNQARVEVQIPGYVTNIRPDSVPDSGLSDANGDTQQAAGAFRQSVADKGSSKVGEGSAGNGLDMA